jgi:uncharacterized protein (DUF58 family)
MTIFPILGLLALAWIGGLVVAAWKEAATGPVRSWFEVGRKLPNRLSYSDDARIELTVTNLGPERCQMTLRDEVPDQLGAEQQIFEIDLDPGAQARLEYSIRPFKRGVFPFGRTILRVSWGKHLVEKTLTLDVPGIAKVYPRFRGSSDYALLAKIAEREEALRPRRLRGQGSDYESLRPYAPGDDPRTIEWKSSARRGILISRTPQVERGQHLAVLVDTGRLMSSSVQGHSRLEYSLEAAVRLSYVIRKRGDTLSLAAFSNQVEKFLPRLKKNAIMPSVLEALCTVEQRTVESDYWRVTAQILSRLHQRSLVVLFTQVLDAAGSKGLIHTLRRASSKHLVLCVVLSDPELSETSFKSPNTPEEAWRMAAACDLLKRRRLALEIMKSHGVLVLECSPTQLSHQLIRRYLEIRRENLQ